jgi:hypothetical protein
LSEFEILSIVSRCLNQFKNEKAKKPHQYRLRNITITPEEWNNWRSNVITYPLNSSGHLRHFPSLRYSSLIKLEFDPDWFYIQKIIDYVGLISSENNEEIEQFKNCFIFAVMLAELLSAGKLNASIFDLSNIMRWKGTQFVIEQCHGPSSEIIHLMTDTINCFYLFYKHQYERIGLIKVPYRPFLSEEIINISHFQRIIDKVRLDSSTRYLSWSHGILELRVEKIDAWIKDSKTGSIQNKGFESVILPSNSIPFTDVLKRQRGTARIFCCFRNYFCQGNI